MQHFALADVLKEQQRAGRPYLEFLRHPSLSVGLYALPAGGVDGQKPHTEDEVYYIVSGRGAIQVAGESRPVEPGALVFVAAGVEHRFHSISEDLRILVFFAPAEGSQAE
jgi:mannose-6-phosphate isomerase-like protein (cupin superfamily)